MACWTFKIQTQWSSINNLLLPPPPLAGQGCRKGEKINFWKRVRAVVLTVWFCVPDTPEFSLRKQLRKRTCFRGWLWQGWKAKWTLKGEGKVNLTDRVGCLCQFQQHLPQLMSISWPIQQKLLWQHLGSSRSLPVQLL